MAEIVMVLFRGATTVVASYLAGKGFDKVVEKIATKR